jgi:large subunit ribosomal protein L31
LSGALTAAIYPPPREEESFVKKDIHPDYHEIIVVMTDGSTFQTRSTYGKAGDSLSLDVDPKSHPAWTGGNVQVIERGRVEQFNRRFQNFRRKK